MSNPIKGTIAVSANYGVGKTTFALECGYLPQQICIIDDDGKDLGIDPNNFGCYVNLLKETSKMTISDIHQYCLDLILELDNYEVIIWDTWTKFAETFYPYVVAHPDEFRTHKQYAATKEIVGGRMWQDSYRYEGAVISRLKEKCRLLILTFHLKDLYVDQIKIPDKFKPGHDNAISKHSDLRIWLTPNPNSQVPNGLVMKNISKRVIIDGKVRTERVLPLKIEKCNWDTGIVTGIRS